MWTERDPRVPPHRRIGPDGRPTVADIAARIRADQSNPMSGLMTITRKQEGDVIGYCGLLFNGCGSPDEPELAYELLGRAQGVVSWTAEAGDPRLWAGVRAWNLASRNVLRKLGFVDTGSVEPDADFGDLLITTKRLATALQ
jgi:ribosomal-protein-alanine N-acetyltransferase